MRIDVFHHVQIDLDAITGPLDQLKETIMATLQDIKDQIAGVADGVNTLQAQIASLKDQLAAGSPVTLADLDELSASLAAIKADEDSTPA